MFMGESTHNLDPKGRLTIPAKFRNQLGETFFIAKWMEHSLRAMPLDVWNKLEEQLNNLPIGKKDARAFKRFVMAGSMQAEFDKQGRVIIASNLKEHAELEKEVVVTGVGDSFEIWSADNWQAYTEETAENFDDIAEGLVDFDF
ncbi:division/cell wall cluster transcriptional repressor MraZ [Fructobacillus fructosus]|uniref:division/cell wall cluster transcriptional repressor MraZ n=1 Tax=Fructobacillus fructosus TaxID=1631 RepID=UPI002D9857BE|nr:DNA-binding transcriptional regulator and inhibitor of RsmH methyltransferase activity (MraZ) [Fructobacillus fructosus]CAK1233968.1 DNA-binding transcriptional regulator and inhibitor of RsmH methyltransferase activity (MraZ) [Fructobacillus fructosus]CAK1235569.1 DNA-binding transcriptional regulator and inhibitor of RsmH methyltransferase activity (MraZ) [Fructobacillus fructosus]